MRPETENIDPHASLGELYRLYLSLGPKRSSSLPEIAKQVPDLDYLATFFYEDLFRKSVSTDFESWATSMRNCPDDLQKIAGPFMLELYCRGKAVFIGIQLRSSGVWRFGKWNACLMAQLDQQERKIIGPFSKQIYQRAKAIMNESIGENRGQKMTTRQRGVILAGLALVLVMLLIPPWKSSGGYSRGYHFIFMPPPSVTTIDLPRLFVQGLIIVLLAGGVVFVLNNRQK